MHALFCADCLTGYQYNVCCSFSFLNALGVFYEMSGHCSRAGNLYQAPSSVDAEKGLDVSLTRWVLVLHQLNTTTQ